MAKTAVTDWSTTAASNTDIDGTSIDEGCAAAGINNAIRSIMAQIATWITTIPVTAASLTEFWTGSAANRSIAPSILYAANASVSLSDGTTITPDANAGLNFHVTLSANRTLANMTNHKAGQSGRIRIVQDGTGGRTLSYGSNYKFPGGSAPALSTAAGAVDLLFYYVHSTSAYECSILRDVR